MKTFVACRSIIRMKLFLALYFLAFFGHVQAFVSKPFSLFVPSLASVTSRTSPSPTFSLLTMNAAEKTYIMIKPDGIQVRMLLPQLFLLLRRHELFGSHAHHSLPLTAAPPARYRGKYH
jgi:hypothetical protein